MTERRTRRTGVARLRPLIPVAMIWSAGLVLLAGLALQRSVPYDELLLDPNNLAGVPWYTGLVSNLGVLGWSTATATGFFGAWTAGHGGRPAAAHMLFWGAGLSTVLLLDDLFQLHVVVEPLLGVPKPAVYGIYLALATHWVLRHRRELQRTRFVLLLAAGAAFATSVGFDQAAGRLPIVGSLDTGQILLIEDAAKFLGVLAWAQYFALTSGAIVTSIVAELRSRPEPAVPETVRSGPVPTSGPSTEVAAGGPALAAIVGPQSGADASSASSSA